MYFLCAKYCPNALTYISERKKFKIGALLELTLVVPIYHALASHQDYRDEDIAPALKNI